MTKEVWLRSARSVTAVLADWNVSMSTRTAGRDSKLQSRCCSGWGNLSCAAATTNLLVSSQLLSPDPVNVIVVATSATHQLSATTSTRLQDGGQQSPFSFLYHFCICNTTHSPLSYLSGASSPTPPPTRLRHGRLPPPVHQRPLLRVRLILLGQVTPSRPSRGGSSCISSLARCTSECERPFPSNFPLLQRVPLPS